jgi:hypothetical protein
MIEEACRIVVVLRGPGAVDVGAPMRHKDLCYDILKDARSVIERSGDEVFLSTAECRIIITMSMQGLVDVSAPLPNRELCYQMLKNAKDVIERYDDDSAPAMRAFDGAMVC